MNNPNTSSPSVRNRLRGFGITPRKSLGQNFLTDDSLARRIVSFANVKPQDTAIEIGPGIGALTRHLVNAARHVVAIELDQHLIPILHAELGDPTNLSIIQADALEVDFGQLPGVADRPSNAGIRFIGNLPYYITSAAIRRMLESGLPVASIVLTVQLEVAQRIVAQPDDMSLMAVSVQFYGKPELLMRVHPSAFYPQPDVDSAVLRITPHPRPSGTDAADAEASADALFALARAGFSQRRKQLRNTLAAGLHQNKAAVEQLLNQVQIEPTRRAETLSIADWVRLAEAYGNAKRSLKRSSASAINAGEQAPNAENTTEL